MAKKKPTQNSKNAKAYWDLIHRLASESGASSGDLHRAWTATVLPWLLKLASAGHDYREKPLTSIRKVELRDLMTTKPKPKPKPVVAVKPTVEGTTTQPPVVWVTTDTNESEKVTSIEIEVTGDPLKVLGVLIELPSVKSIYVER